MILAPVVENGNITSFTRDNLSICQNENMHVENSNLESSGGPVRLAYQPPANSTFLSEQTSHQHPARTSQQYSSLRTNQHQPSATSQPNRLLWPRWAMPPPPFMKTQLHTLNLHSYKHMDTC
jgi:hypothetical protein